MKKSDELTESTIPFDKSEIFYSYHRESKKLTRLPFYKLEELKKQEEKKLKQHHKKKKDDILTGHLHNQTHHSHSLHPKKKSLKTVLKKIKEEKHKNDQTETKEKHVQINIPNSNNTNSNVPIPSEIGDKLKLLKYGVNEIHQKKDRLSRKQRKLQEAENTLASFLSREDKSHYKEDSGSNLIFNRQNSFKNINMNSNISGHSTGQNENKLIPTNSSGNVILIKKGDSKEGLATTGEVLGKKRKRINKFKKAVYKYRFLKKQFIFNNLFQMENQGAKNEDEIKIQDTEINNVSSNEQHFNSDDKFKSDEKNNEEIKNDTKINVYKLEEKLSNEKSGVDLDHSKIQPQSNQYISNYPMGSSKSPSFNNNMMYNYYNNIPQGQGTQYTDTLYNYNYYQNTPMNSYMQYNNYNNVHYPANYYPNYGYPYYNGYDYSNNQNMYSNYPNDSSKSFLFENGNKHNQKNNKVENLSNKKPKNFKEKKDLSKEQNLLGQKFSEIKISTKLPKLYPIQNLNQEKKGFLFETSIKDSENQTSDENKESTGILQPKQEIPKEEFNNFLKSTYHIDKDITQLKGSEFNDYISQNSHLKKVNIKNLQKISESNLISDYINKYEGIQPGTNINKKVIREYVDQILDPEVDKKFGDFIVKMRDIYYKKKATNPLKAKRRFVVGMREIEKFLRLEEVKCLFIVPNIEKVEGEHSLDERLLKIFSQCEKKGIPKFFGLNKFKLGKLARKKHSSVSMLAFVNVEGFERDFRELTESLEKYKKMFYEKFNEKREIFKDNKFISQELFDVYNNKNNLNSEEINK
jgi:hypothetical protein